MYDTRSTNYNAACWLAREVAINTGRITSRLFVSKSDVLDAMIYDMFQNRSHGIACVANTDSEHKSREYVSFIISPVRPKTVVMPNARRLRATSSAPEISSP